MLDFMNAKYERFTQIHTVLDNLSHKLVPGNFRLVQSLMQRKRSFGVVVLWDVTLPKFYRMHCYICVEFISVYEVALNTVS